MIPSYHLRAFLPVFVQILIGMSISRSRLRLVKRFLWQMDLRFQTFLVLFPVFVAISMPTLAQVSSEEEVSSSADTPKVSDPLREPKKSNGMALPSILPSTGITSILGEESRRPDAVYLRRENGEAVFVPQIRYQEFERYLLQQTSKNATEVPAAMLESVSVTGAIRDGYADLQIECQAAIAETETKIVELNLGLGNCNIQGIPKTEGGKRSLLYPSKNSLSLIWAIQPDGSKTYTIRIEVLVKVERVGLDSSMRLETPIGPTKIDLQIPSNANSPAANIQWVGVNSEVLETRVENDLVRAIVTGRGGTGLLNWNEGYNQPSLGSVEAETDTRFLLNRQSLRWDVVTKLRVRTTNRVGPQDVILELPENAVWIPSQVSGLQSLWTLGSVPSTTTDSKTSLSNGEKSENLKGTEAGSGDVLEPARQRLLLRLSERIRGFTEDIPIEWRLPISDKTEQAVSLSSLVVLDAQRHEGRISIEIPVDQQFSWSPTSEFQFLNQAVTSNRSDYEFRFARQGGVIAAVLRTDQAQSRLKSIVLARFSADEVQLDGIYQFTQSPASLQELTFEAPGWTLHGLSWVDTSDLIPADLVGEASLRVVPGSTVDSGQVVSDPDSRSIRLLATRRFSAETDELVLINLPLVRWLKNNREQIQERGDGWLYVAPGPFELFPEQVKLSGMTRAYDRLESIQSYFQLSGPIENPLAYRFRSGSTPARWESRLMLTPRVVTGICETDVKVQDAGWNVQRRWRIDIEGPATQQLKFRVPVFTTPASGSTPLTSTDSNRGKWELRVNDQVVATTTQLDLVDPSSYVIKADLVDPTRKAFVELSYSDMNDMDKTTVSDSDSVGAGVGASKLTPRKIPLAKLWIDGDLAIQSSPATIRMEENVLCELNYAGGIVRRYTSFDGPITKPLFEVDAFIDLASTDLKLLDTPPVGIEKIWVQTLANELQIRQRVVMRAVTNGRTVAFQLPTRWNPDTLEVLVDGVKVPVFPSPNEEGYRCPLVANGVPERSSHVLEFWNWYPRGPKNLRILEPLSPKILDSGRNVSCVWQIAIPIEEILWSLPVGWLADWNWAFSDWGFKRAELQQQADFERLFGATGQPPLPQSTNRYVITSIIKYPSKSNAVVRKMGPESREPQLDSAFQADPIERNGVVVIPRYWLWLPVGITLLVVSVLWNTLAWFRSPIVLTAGLVSLFLAAMVAPDMTILICLTAAVSLSLIGIVQVCQWAWPIRVKRRDSTKATQKSAVLAGGSTQINSIGGSNNESRSGSKPTQFSPTQTDEPTPSAADAELNPNSGLNPPVVTITSSHLPPSDAGGLATPSTRTNVLPVDSYGAEPQK